jgi:hypothetical protein
MPLTTRRPLNEAAAVLLAPTGDAAPVERAVVLDAAVDHPPQTLLSVTVQVPGGARVWKAWTTGGLLLGDRIDQYALAAGRDGADWLHLTTRHEQFSTRGRVEIRAYPLRPVHADLTAGVQAPGLIREALRRAVALAGRPPETVAPWLGFGPALHRCI